MSGSLNKVQLIGNLGRDPEIRSFANGGRVANIRLATTDTWKDKMGQKQERTEWHSVAIFSDGLITVVERYLRKGAKIYVEGALQTRKWTDNANQERYSTEIVVRNFNHQIIMLGGDRNGVRGGDSMSSFGDTEGQVMGSNMGSNMTSKDDVLPDDDIPF